MAIDRGIQYLIAIGAVIIILVGMFGIFLMSGLNAKVNFLQIQYAIAIGAVLVIIVGMILFSRAKVNMKGHHKIEAIAITGLVAIAALAMIVVIFNPTTEIVNALLTLAGVAVGGITGFLSHKLPKPNKTNLFSPGDPTVKVGEDVKFTLTALSNLNFTLAYKMSGNVPEGATLDEQTGEFAWKADKEGTYDVTFTATDNQGGDDSKTIKITVEAA